MNEEIICTECGHTLEENEGHVFDGRHLCEDCYRSLTVECDCCGTRIWREDSEGNESIVLCQRCWDDRYTTCEECGTIIANEEAWYEDGGDFPYCYECFNRKRNRPIKNYNYKPEPIFYGSDSDLYLGVELEIDRGGEDKENAQQILDVANRDGERIYCKRDGSLSAGLELVSHPMTIAFQREQMNWKAVFDEAMSMDYLSHCTETCGLHIHVNRDAFGEYIADQEACISRIVFFVEKHWDDLVRFSRRKLSNLNRWASRYATISPTAQETYKKAKDSHAGRYVAVNLSNEKTIEFRLFRGTLRYETFIATLQLVHLICDLSRTLSDRDFEEMSWRDFVLKVDADKMPELVSYLKIRRLYVNEPAESDDQEV